jgi:hypothetical protein
MRNILLIGILLLFTPVMHAQALPWVFPGDFGERIRLSDLVISGTVEETSEAGPEFVSGIELVANTAHVRVDRIFEGYSSSELQFKWFRLWSPAGEGMLYSGPPVANFKPHERYLIFLKKSAEGWVVAMPVYALEAKLAPASPSNAVRDLSSAPAQARYQALAEELEAAALQVPNPPPGMTGEAATYFSAVFDLIGACAGPFYEHFESSPSRQLRGAATEWLVINRHHTTCTQMLRP